MKTKWVKKRHQRVINFLRRFFLIGYKKRYHIEYDTINLDTPHLIMCNHQSGEDQFYVAQMLEGKFYFVISDDFDAIPIASPFIRWAVHPIPYKKASTDLTFLRTCRTVVKEGGSIIIYPEGNRTYRGKTEHINPTIAKMAKFLNLPIDILNIKGGFGANPRFGNAPRKGKVEVRIRKQIPVDEYKELSYDDLAKMIEENLQVDDTALGQNYESKKKAEDIERVLYRCPKCGISSFTSKGNFFWCNKCQERIEYLPNLTLSAPSKFKTLSDWYDFQEQELLKDKLESYDQNHLFFEDDMKIYQVIPHKFKKPLDKKSHIKCFNNRFEIKFKEEIKTIYFEDILSSGVFGANKFNIFLDDITYQIKNNKKFNALKYVQFIYKYKIEKGKINNEFLGI